MEEILLLLMPMMVLWATLDWCARLCGIDLTRLGLTCWLCIGHDGAGVDS